MQIEHQQKHQMMEAINNEKINNNRNSCSIVVILVAGFF